MTASGVFPKVDGDILYSYDVNNLNPLVDVGSTIQLGSATDWQILGSKLIDLSVGNSKYHNNFNFTGLATGGGPNWGTGSYMFFRLRVSGNSFNIPAPGISGNNSLCGDGLANRIYLNTNGFVGSRGVILDTEGAVVGTTAGGNVGIYNAYNKAYVVSGFPLSNNSFVVYYETQTNMPVASAGSCYFEDYSLRVWRNKI